MYPYTAGGRYSQPSPRASSSRSRVEDTSTTWGSWRTHTFAPKVFRRYSAWMVSGSPQSAWVRAKAQMPARAVIRSGSRQFWRVRNMSVPIISHSSAPGFWA